MPWRHQLGDTQCADSTTPPTFLGSSRFSWRFWGQDQHHFYIGQAQSMRAVESFPSIYDTEVLLLVLLLHASTRSQRQGRRAVWFPKKWLSKNAGRTLRRKLFASQNPGIKSRPPWFWRKPFWQGGYLEGHRTQAPRAYRPLQGRCSRPVSPVPLRPPPSPANAQSAQWHHSVALVHRLVLLQRPF